MVKNLLTKENILTISGLSGHDFFLLESLIIQNGSVSPDIDEKVRQAAIISSFT